MSDLKIEPEMPDETLKEIPIERKPDKVRIEWVDMARGFIVLFMIATLSFPGDSTLNISSIPILRGIFQNAEPGTGVISLYDLGAAVFLFVLGFTMPISFRKRKELIGAAAARRYIIFRYLLLLLLGFVIANAELIFLNYYSILEDQTFIFAGLSNIPLDHHPVLFIIPWHVVSTIAISGLVGFVFMGVRNPRYRFFLGYGWAILYQVGLHTTTLITYAQESVHSGILSAIMGYGSIVIIASAMGDYVFFTDLIETKKLRTLLLFGGINLAVTVLLTWLAFSRLDLGIFSINMQTVSLPFIVTAVGASCVGLWVFYQVNSRFKWKIRIFQMFGLNPFLIYFITVLPDYLFEGIMGYFGFTSIPWVISLVWGIVMIYYASFVAWRLYKKSKRVSTMKTSLIFLVTIIAILLLVIVLELTGAVDLLTAI